MPVVTSISASPLKESETHYLPATGLSRYGKAESAFLESLRASVQTAVDGVDDWLGADLAAAEEPAVEALDRIFAALDTVELEIDVALGIWIYSNVNDVTVFVFAFSLDVIFEFFDPRITFLSESTLAFICLTD